MKQTLKQFLAFAMAALVLWAGNGYGVLEHLCEEHGKHQHILSNWIQTSCEHEHHQDADSHLHHPTDSGFHASQSGERISFVHFYAETVSKTSVVSVVNTPLFQVTLPPTFVFQTVRFSSKTHPFSTASPPFRRTFGRSLLAWVQSFLI
ncbi:MAG: hypothetical protein R2822_30170 [Spirosomataceae bacterium]|jgi:ketopantoate reductase